MPVPPTDPARPFGGGRSGRTGGRGRGPGRGPGRGRGGQPRHPTRKTTVFKGNTDAMNGHVFQCQKETQDKSAYLKTVEALGEYISKTLDYPRDITGLCKNFTVPVLTEPADLSEDERKSETKKLIWKTQVINFVKRQETQEKNVQVIFSVIWGQCSPTMQSKLQSLDEYDSRSEAHDCAWILQEIKGVTHKFEGTRYICMSLHDARQQFYNCKQEPKQSLHDYLGHYRTVVEVLDHYGATIDEDGSILDKIPGASNKFDVGGPNISSADYDTLQATYLKEREAKRAAAARDRTIAYGFLKGANPAKYYGLCADLENQYARGTNQYPEDITSAYNLLLNHRTTEKPRAHPPATPTAPAVPPVANAENVEDIEVPAVTFLQHHGAPVVGTDGITHPGVTCFKCDKKGHYAPECPDSETDDTVVPDTDVVQLLQVHDEEDLGPSEFTFIQSNTTTTFDDDAHARLSMIPDTWVLLDSQSTVSVFKNPKFLTDIKEKDGDHLKVYTNGGSQVSKMVGTIKEYGEVWFNTESLANILSLAQVRLRCRVTMDTSVEASMNVHRKDGSIMKFTEYRNGLYKYDAAAKQPINTSNSTVAFYSSPDFVFLDLVEENKNLYTARQIEGANKARALYRKLVYPSQQYFEYMLRHNKIRNCPVTCEDAQRAIAIFGPSVAGLQGKTVNRGSTHVESFVPERIPAIIRERHPNITMCMDIFYVNGNPFFTTISRKINFRTVASIPSRSKAILLRETRVVKTLYETQGFNVPDIHADKEFACITLDMLPTRLNIVDADDHVHEVERSIRTIKERIRCTIHGLPFRRIPKTLVRAITENSVKMLNQFPSRNGVSNHISPLTIMTGVPLPDYNTMTLELGTYVQIYEPSDITNTMRTRETAAITLTPTGNAQGGYWFLSLVTGARLSRQQWDVLPMPQHVIATVERMGLEEGQPLMVGGTPIFEWAPGEAIVDDVNDNIDFIEEAEDAVNVENDDDNIDDEDIPPFDHNEHDFNEDDDDPAQITADHDAVDDDAPVYDDNTGDDDDSNNPDNGIFVEDVDEDDNSDFTHDNGIFVEEADDDDIDNDNNSTNDNAEELFPTTPPNTIDDDTQKGSEDNTETNNTETANDGPAFNTRKNPRSYANRFSHTMDNPASSQSYDAQTQLLQTGIDDLGVQLLQTALDDFNDTGSILKMNRYITGFMMTQMSATKGIKLHGQKAIDALMVEFQQLHDMNVFEGMDPTLLSARQKRSALRAINLIKEKRCGRMKGRSVADGSTERERYAGVNTSSPTVSTNALMMSMLIDAWEGRDVACADVPGAYLHADMDSFTLIRYEGESVDILCKINPDWEDFITIEGGKKVLYLRLIKALYGCIKSALLWYELFVTTLQKVGFELNPYDACVANKMIEGKQCTIAWYVDDNKISHMSPAVVTKIIKYIESKFGKLTVTRGQEHVFLGMHIKFLENRNMEVLMKDYLKESIDEFLDDIVKSSVTPAAKNLFDVNDDDERLSTKRSDNFHSITCKLLYVAHRGRPDILLPITFLCTRVSKSNVKDWEKLKRVLQYLRGTLDLVLTLGADDITKMKTWVDASYAVHADMKSHTGGCISFGRGAIICKSTKQKLNTKSSTEAELVGASDVLPTNVWLEMFLGAQGYSLEENEFAQDNQSTMKLETNGRRSCGQQSRHIDIRFFWIKDRIDSGNMNVVYCPTEEMLADFFTKPLQGALFRKFRDVVMGMKHINTLKRTALDPSQERVGNHKMVSDKRPETNSLGYKEDSEPSIKRVSYADTVMRNSKSEEMKE